MRFVWKAFGIFIICQVISGILIFTFDSLFTELAAIPIYILQVFLLMKLYRNSCDRFSEEKYSLKSVVRILLFLAAFYLCFLIAESGFYTYFMPDYDQDIELTLAILMNATIFGPISEEIMFRGILLRHINKKYSFVVANLIQAAAFSAVHFDLHFLPFGLLFGVSLGIIGRRLGLYSAILIHMVNNIMAAILPVEINLNVSREMFLAIGCVFAILAAVMLWRLNKYERPLSTVHQQL